MNIVYEMPLYRLNAASHLYIALITFEFDCVVLGAHVDVVAVDVR